MLGQGETQMVGGVAGREERFECPVRAFDRLAVLEDDVGGEAGVDKFRAFRIDQRALIAGVAAKTADLRFRRIGHAGQPVDVIAVGVGDDDMADGATADEVDDGLKMRFILGPRVDDREIVRADDVGVCSLEGEHAWIVGNEANDARRQLARRGVGEFHLSPEFEVGHRCSFLGIRNGRRSKTDCEAGVKLADRDRIPDQLEFACR